MLHGNWPVVLIADKAGAHQSSVCEQRGIAFEPLPTACPELNPVERFFEEVRKELSDQVFNTIGEGKITYVRLCSSTLTSPALWCSCAIILTSGMLEKNFKIPYYLF